jgi:uncharacterized protein
MRGRTGTAQLPLHGGRAPAWLFSRKVQLAREITIHVGSEFGPDEMLLRLSDPFWFQAFGCVLGFDWHSSGVTTTVTGAVKEGIKGLELDLGDVNEPHAAICAESRPSAEAGPDRPLG